ncbi:MAG TPA: proton-conducting transporter membrane subunit, partial [Vicinamibacterales bacterium]|nr:proton-conducting transporter membrane subunit [Vicinamibacterales bacterium]
MTSLEALMLAGVGPPAVLLAVLGGASLLNRPVPERWTGRLAAAAMAISCTAFCVALLLYATTRTGGMVLYGSWSTSHAGGIAIEFLLDGTSLGFAALTSAIAGVVAAFSNRYLHREPGYNRYFFLLAMFVTGMLLVALAGNMEVLFAGWELVGLSSALLVAFFHERPAPVTNALRVFTVYRISDAAMLSAAVLLHHVAGSGSLALLFGGADAASTAGLTGTDATMIAVLLIVAVAGKSALLPFSGWLPRAMEGPTPSSAIFYGALSIHAGAYLLLRAAPIIEASSLVAETIIVVGLLTALHGTFVGRACPDAKNSLAYAAMAQLGIIFIEIGFGWYQL